MNNTSKRKQQTSLVRQLKRRLLVVVSLLAFVLIFNLPVDLFYASIQRNLDEQQVALQEAQNVILLSMLNQQSDLRRYINNNDTTYLKPFKNDRQQYLLSVQQLKDQAQGRNFRGTATALAQVEKRANSWYSTYAEVQIKNMQSGKLVTARSTSTAAVGRALFDQFRTSVTQLQAAIGHDVQTRQSTIDINSRLALISALLLSAIAMIILWYTFIRFINALKGQLSMLKTTTNQLGSGDLSARVQELGYNELNTLGQTFNTMAEDLAEHSRELEHINHELRQQRDELMTVNTALEEANRTRSQFLSTMSHELRTPLASIIGFSQLLLGDAAEVDLDQVQKDNLERILKNGQHLLGLVSDVLDLEKIEAGHMEVTYTRMDVRELLTSVVEETQSIAISRHLVLRAIVEDEVDTLESNPVKLRQILLNLVSNALKFTEQGEVTLSARRAEADHVVFSVKDTGIGIPAEIQGRVFEAFYQEDGGYTRKNGGTGLGLSIVSQLTTLLGGTIELTSAPGQGSTFTVILPVKAVHQQSEQDIPRLHPEQQEQAHTPAELTPDTLDKLLADSVEQEAAERQRDLVLAVDDNPDVIVLIKVALQDTPYTVVGVQDSLLAMELVQELQPCAITLDVMMPDLNGWQFLHQLKANPATASIPVVMLTVLSEPTTGYVLGADDYLIKPFQKEVLLATLQRLLASKKGLSQASQRETLPV